MRELLTDYGRIDYLFFGFSSAGDVHHAIWGDKARDDWGSEELLAMVRELQPGIAARVECSAHDLHDICVEVRRQVPHNFAAPHRRRPLGIRRRGSVSDPARRELVELAEGRLWDCFKEYGLAAIAWPASGRPPPLDGRVERLSLENA